MADMYLKSLECLCIKGVSGTCPGGGELNATLTAEANLRVSIEPEAVITSDADKETLPEIIRAKSTSVDMEFLAEINAKMAARIPFGKTILEHTAEIEDNLLANYSMRQSVDGSFELLNTYTDKIAGEFGDFNCQQKLYPYNDLSIDAGFGSFIGPFFETSDLWEFVNEGVYQGLLVDGGDSILLSDDSGTYIHPNTFHTEGLFQYKCNITPPLVRPDESAFRIRVSAPTKNYESNLPPLYTIYNIKFSDPSGNLIVKYGDIQLRGDSTDYPTPNYATYSSLPEINAMDKYDWERRNAPHMHEGKTASYILSFSVRAVALDDPFTEGFDEGFEENFIFPDIYESGGNNYLSLDGAPLSTQEVNFINPTKGFRVSAFEICNSGGFGPRREDTIPLYLGVREYGHRLERCYHPTFMPASGFDTTIWPSVDTLWVDGNDTVGGTSVGVTNEDVCGAAELVRILNELDARRYINLKDSSQVGKLVNPKGKLTLRFGGCISDVDEITDGAFNSAFDQGADCVWWSPSGAFNTENRTEDIQRDSTFQVVESVTLKILARKSTFTTESKALDVVGYSDDKLLHVTTPSGGFLQSPSGVCGLDGSYYPSIGTHPVLSGFYSESNDFALDGTAISQKEQYFETSGNAGGDHYSLIQVPVIDDLDWELYEIPLQILDDDVRLGLSRDYSASSFFEKLFLDIYPVPTGLDIAYTELCVRYAPQNAINIYTQGGEKIGKAQDGRSEGALFPSSMGADDYIMNAGSGLSPLSRLENLPHLYGSPKTIKTNYARRWRGVEGTVRGPYDPDMFGFGFENPVIDYPFLSGYYKFDRIVDGYVQSSDLGPTGIPSGLGTVSGLLIGNTEIHQNIGWRYSSGTLFGAALPRFSGNHTTTDWTSLSQGLGSGYATFSGNPMYGKISDSFDRVIRISGDSKYVNFGNIDSTSGFSVFIKFTPDVNISGQNHNLFNSGVLFSKWDTPGDMEFALAYSNGQLTALISDTGNVIHEIKDPISFSGYQYPLSVLLTYNHDAKGTFNLYTDNEASTGNFAILRGSVTEIVQNGQSSDLILGFSPGSGVGMNMLVSEFGISTYDPTTFKTNLVETTDDEDWTNKRVAVQTFFDNSRSYFSNSGQSYTGDSYKLWDRVNDDTYNDWQIGAFKYCQFSVAFDQWQKRPNTQQIVFNLKHHGSGYIQNAELPMPEIIDSGVAYHTQIENDFLRFHLSDAVNSFYSVNRRITKNLPCDYKFSERALVVESVIEHTLGDGIVWSGCEDILPSGPRMIVSLYTRNQEPYWTTDEPNWGLVNRKIHYIEPSSCLTRLDSVFDYDSLCDETEQWALFPEEPRLKDFTERYFVDDINKMFVQYDLVYPSGRSFESKIQLHSSHVRMADVNLCAVRQSGSMPIYMSGAFPADGQIALNIGGFPTEQSGILPFNMNVPLPVDIFDSAPSGFSLMISGAFLATQSLNLFIPPQSGYANLNLMISGEFPLTSSSGVNLAMPKVLGRHDSSDDNNPITSIAGVGNFFGMPLTAFNAEVSIASDGPYLKLTTFAATEGTTGQQTEFPLLLWNDQSNIVAGDASGIVTLNVRGSKTTDMRRITGSMPLFINAPNIMNVRMPLYLYNPKEEALSTDSMNLFTSNYGAIGSAYGRWFNNNYGTGIELEDNSEATLPVSNEIRGVDLTAYGSCDGDSPSKAIDQALITDCTVWREATCNDGGVFRAKDTYTNSGAVNFSGGLGYDGNYYGIRKYTELVPSVAYTTTLIIKTGTSESISVPRNFEEWGYGICGPKWGPTEGEGCCVDDCKQGLAFSGVKIVSDTISLIDPDYDLVIASGRPPGGKYGTTVSVKGDLMAVAAPYIDIPDDSPYDGGIVDVSGAGAVFLYRRGVDVPGTKAYWDFAEMLMLPTGFRKDYIQKTAENLIVFEDFSISGNKWQIGQEGREFGTSLDICSSGDREVVVVGAPRAKWSRQFSDIATSGVPSAAMVVVDLFSYDERDINNVAGTAQRFNILWKYFSAPWNPGMDEWYAQINPKVLVFQLTFADRDYPVIPTDQSDWFIHRYIPRLDDEDLLIELGSAALGGVGTNVDFIRAGEPIVFNTMFSGIIDGFFAAFPAEVAVYSGVPAIVGMFKEQSGSTANALQYKNSGGTIVNIYDEFTNFYRDHSYASGVTNMITQLAENGHLNTVLGESENWATTTADLITDTFDTGRLSSTFTNSTLNRDFIASGIGQEWGDTHGTIVTEFQVPPASGGRVFIFEKERENFNCIQVIISPNDIGEFTDDGDVLNTGYGKTYNDRFGHSVSISKNGEIVSIGSPWNRTSCKILNRDETEVQKAYDSIEEWLGFKSNAIGLRYYNKTAAISGEAVAKVAAYDWLTSSQRFSYRNDIDFWGASTLPTPYKESFNYGYNNIAYIGTRKFLSEEFAPTSRLGWSTAVNDDGDIVAFGAPTDSFNEFEDVNVWGDRTFSLDEPVNNPPKWASYTHAGAVRIFKSRDLYPHNKVVEIGRFGNLDRSRHQEEREAGFYDQMDLFFGSGADGTSSYLGHPWRRTDFSELEIPQDAGLAFIMTPELDAASDEMIDNIKNWLALGDRNLVIVGNDPVWEENGLYADSNVIVNKLLAGLDSRMRIFPAKNEAYSMQGCVTQDDLNDNQYNITKAKIPSYSVGASLGTSNYYAKGVGDIRMDLSIDGLENYSEYFECPEGRCCDCDDLPVINARCEFPLAHGGDLRAEWSKQCIRTMGNQCSVITYKKNWPLNFNNFIPDCDDPPDPLFQKARQEPVPVLTTAEHLPPEYWYRLASSGLRCGPAIPIYEWVVTQRGQPVETWADVQLNQVAFSIQGDGDSSVTGIFNGFDYNGDFIDPDLQNGRDGLLQGIGASTGDVRTQTRVVSPISVLGLVESGRFDNGDHNNSKIYIMASQWCEDDASRGINVESSNFDQNTQFYLNMIRKETATLGSCAEKPRGMHINGFTGHSSLEDAYYGVYESIAGNSNYTQDNYGLGSTIRILLSDRSVSGFEEGQEVADIHEFIDFVWIAAPEGRPSDEDVAEIKGWLNLGNKKLIITYNATSNLTRQELASNVDYLCSQLNLTSRPFFIPNQGEYFVTDEIIIGYNRGGDPQVINDDEDSIEGCLNGYGWTGNYNSDTSVTGIDFNPASSPDATISGPGEVFDRRKFVPLSGGLDFENIIWWEKDVVEEYTVSSDRWTIDGLADISFPALEATGYRVFINWVSETVNEEFNICGNFQNIEFRLEEDDDDGGDGPPGGGGGLDAPCPSPIDLSKTTVYQPQQAVFDVKVKENFDSILINLDTGAWDEFIDPELIADGVVPVTPRLLSISGCPIPITYPISTVATSGKRIIGWRQECEYIVTPAQSGFLPSVSRPVMHLSDIYCPPGGFTDDCADAEFGTKLIEDGPIVVAEEYEGFSSFPAGRRRSKIIVVSDSTLLQGECEHYRADTLTGNQTFIRSLYPPSPEEYTGAQSEDGRSQGGSAGGGGGIGGSTDTLVNGKNFEFVQKLRAPERGSPQKYAALSGLAIPLMLTPLWGPGASHKSCSAFDDGEDYYDPTTYSLRPDEITSPDEIDTRIIAFGNSSYSSFGTFFRFSGDFLNLGNYDAELDLPAGSNRTYLLDATIEGGLNELMKVNNTDYLDLDVYYSGCLGDLFGYSIDLSNDTLVVGAPFNAFHAEDAVSGVSGIVGWNEICVPPTKGSGLRIAEDGGAGAVFVFKNTGSGSNFIEEFLPFEWQQKIKPSGLGVGIYDFTPSPELALIKYRGNHQIDDPSLIIEFAKRSDNFGIAVAIDCDMIVVGAPNHDFETLHAHIYSGGIDPSGFNTAFQHKSFNAEYDIPQHEYYDLGVSGIRVDQFNGDSGVWVLNNGAVYNFRNELVDFGNREQEWLFTEKLYSQGYNDRTLSSWIDITGIPYLGPTGSASGTENDRFGSSVAINRAERGDSDYTLIVGSPKHDWSTSGIVPDSGIRNAGAVYNFDAMLRGQLPSTPNSGGWMDAHVFGNKLPFDSTDRLEMRVYQSGDSLSYEATGVVFTNQNGDMFLEVSGYDPSEKGFIAHRPYVAEVQMQLLPGEPANDTLNMYMSGLPALSSGAMNLSIIGPDQANVYNTVNMYEFGALGIPSGTMNMFTEAPSGSNAVLNLNVTSTQTIENLNLRLRGY